MRRLIKIISGCGLPLAKIPFYRFKNYLGHIFPWVSLSKRCAISNSFRLVRFKMRCMPFFKIFFLSLILVQRSASFSSAFFKQDKASKSGFKWGVIEYNDEKICCQHFAIYKRLTRWRRILRWIFLSRPEYKPYVGLTCIHCKKAFKHNQIIFTLKKSNQNECESIEKKESKSKIFEFYNFSCKDCIFITKTSSKKNKEVCLNFSMNEIGVHINTPELEYLIECYLDVALKNENVFNYIGFLLYLGNDYLNSFEPDLISVICYLERYDPPAKKIAYNNFIYFFEIVTEKPNAQEIILRVFSRLSLKLGSLLQFAFDALAENDDIFEPHLLLLKAYNFSPDLEKNVNLSKFFAINLCRIYLRTRVSNHFEEFCLSIPLNESVIFDDGAEIGSSKKLQPIDSSNFKQEEIKKTKDFIEKVKKFYEPADRVDTYLTTKAMKKFEKTAWDFVLIE